jgi:hypothetical protein
VPAILTLGIDIDDMVTSILLLGTSQAVTEPTLNPEDILDLPR